ncbi:MAG: LamG domain-containing protein [Candidatus Paceibacterota bacterium]
MSFDGVDDYIDTNGGNNLKLENSGTITVWIYPTSTAGTRVFYGSNNSSMDRDKSPYLVLANGRLNAILGNGVDANRIYSGFFPKLNTWSFVVLNWDGAKINIFHDANIESRIQEYVVKFTANKYYIGACSIVDRKFAGSIDDVRIYNSALSTAQIKQNYIAGLDSMLSNGNLSKDEYNERLEALANN